MSRTNARKPKVQKPFYTNNVTDLVIFYTTLSADVFLGITFHCGNQCSEFKGISKTITYLDIFDNLHFRFL